MPLVEIRSLTELVTADERTRRFAPLGLALDGLLSPEDAAEFQQRCIASADLSDVVPPEVRASFERLRACHTYGVLWYDAYTVAGDLTSVVLEQALRERFVSFYDSILPIGRASGEVDLVRVQRFQDVHDLWRSKGERNRGGWKLRPASPGLDALIDVPLTLYPLLRWARRERLLHGQRNRHREFMLVDARNNFGHGAGYNLTSPAESARRIHELAELINRLWGFATPGGRLYPAALRRKSMVIGWSPEHEQRTIAHHSSAPELEHEGWVYVVVLAIPDDPELSDFDARFERTTYPCDLLWGPGDSSEAAPWLHAHLPIQDEIEFMDRLFVGRVDEEHVDLPQRPEVFLSLPSEERAGTWQVIRADFPNDAFNHARHKQRTDTRGAAVCTCLVEDVAAGPWANVQAVLEEAGYAGRPDPPLDVRVPPTFGVGRVRLPRSS
jgi:hypothetical protein